jgi:uncharacterized lipoprotein YehR (DUF1307 family)
MKLSLPIFLVIMVTGVTFSLVACENKEQAKEVKKNASMTKEEAEEEVKY